MYRDLANSLGHVTLTYVRDVSPADVVARFGGDIATFAPMSVEQVAWTRSCGSEGVTLAAVASLGEWTLIVDNNMVGFHAGMAESLLAGTRVVAHYLQDLTGIRMTPRLLEELTFVGGPISPVRPE